MHFPLAVWRSRSFGKPHRKVVMKMYARLNAVKIAVVITISLRCHFATTMRRKKMARDILNKIVVRT
jgi:hypothetical protein